MKGEGRHNIENLQILNDAALAVFFIRRRALEAEKMDLIQSYVYSGRPILGIRTASHAFDTKGNIPDNRNVRNSGSSGKSEFLTNWPEFDAEILGGNYAGHYRHLREGAEISIVPGMEDNILLKGVDPQGFSSPNWLYRNRPLRSDHAQVLLLGTIPDVPSEPVFWINQNQYGKAIYTSLGHWDDWKNESFKNIIHNSVDYLLNQKIDPYEKKKIH